MDSRTIEIGIWHRNRDVSFKYIPKTRAGYAAIKEIVEEAQEKHGIRGWKVFPGNGYLSLFLLQDPEPEDIPTPGYQRCIELERGGTYFIRDSPGNHDFAHMHVDLHGNTARFLMTVYDPEKDSKSLDCFFDNPASMERARRAHETLMRHGFTEMKVSKSFGVDVYRFSKPEEA